MVTSRVVRMVRVYGGARTGGLGGGLSAAHGLSLRRGAAAVVPGVPERLYPGGVRWVGTRARAWVRAAGAPRVRCVGGCGWWGASVGAGGAVGLAAGVLPRALS